MSSTSLNFYVRRLNVFYVRRQKVKLNLHKFFCEQISKPFHADSVVNYVICFKCYSDLILLDEPEVVIEILTRVVAILDNHNASLNGLNLLNSLNIDTMTVFDGK